MRTIYAEFNDGLLETFECSLEILESLGYSFDAVPGKVGFSKGKGGHFGEILPNYSEGTLAIEMGEGEIPRTIVSEISKSASYFR